MQLEERLYTSSEVADILGVSLRSVYRYLDDGKLNADVKTATGRHRFSKQNILEFLYPNDSEAQREQFPVRKARVRSAPVQVSEPLSEPLQPPKTETKTEQEAAESVDWLKKFRDAAEKYKQEQESSVSKEETHAINGLGYQEQAPLVRHYYKSGVGGLKDIAQNIDRSARKSGVDYAFTMNAGLSLHKPIKPFSILHAYINATDRGLFERMLQLTTAEEGNAQLCLLETSNPGIFADKKEMHGLYVVSDLQIKKDLMDVGEEDLVRELGF